MRHSLRLVLAGLLALVLVFAGGGPAWAVEPSAITPPSLSGGERLFAAHCVGCHINGGNIVSRGRTLKLAALERQGLASPEAIATIAAEGRGRMSGYGLVLGEGGAEMVGEWVWRQAQAGWPRG
jgi:cytochrome c6